VAQGRARLAMNVLLLLLLLDVVFIAAAAADAGVM
jgi:hypothetical protein